MSDKQLVPVRKNSLRILNKENTNHSMPILTYSLIDPLHYSFTCDFSDTIHFRMDESEQANKRSDFTEAQFEDSIPEKHRVYYSLALASGILTGVLSFVKLSEEQLNKIEEWTEKEWQQIVVYAAQFVGCKKSDYKSASKYLVNLAVQRLKKDETAKEYFAILASHPTMAGLVFSMVTQFAGKTFTLSESGKIDAKALPKYYYIGSTNAEKLMASVMYWLFNLAANQASSKRHILDELNIPSELLKMLKNFVNIPLFQKIPENYEQAEKCFSDWLRSTLEDTASLADQEESENSTLIKQLMRMALDLSNEAFPVLINECIVRCLYLIVRLCELVKTKPLNTFDELKAIPATEVLPQDDRLLSGMCLIASASFVGTNLTYAIAKALLTAKADKRKFLQSFLTEINIAGVGRLIFACAADSKFWGDDIKPLFHRKPYSHVDTNETNEQIGADEFSLLSLTPNQLRLLYCFENLAVQQDIARTEKETIVASKRLWLDTWRRYILTGINVSPEFETEFFVEDENELFDVIYNLSKDSSNFSWFYLLTQELALFEPYTVLGCEYDSEFKKLKAEYNYVADQFVRKQTIVNQDEVDRMLKAYKKYSNLVSGKTAKAITTVVTGTAATAVTGGLALAFAPSIAVLIAGEAVVGLHGAALTSASLAFVGGGSLAAGGLGMAGGTAIITGGGALLGLASSGSLSAAALLMSTSSEYWIRQSAKLLTYCKCTLCETLNDKAALQTLVTQVDIVAKRTHEELEALKAEKNSLDKEYIKNLSKICDYLDKVRKELNRLDK